MAVSQISQRSTLKDTAFKKAKATRPVFPVGKSEKESKREGKIIKGIDASW